MALSEGQNFGQTSLSVHKKRLVIYRRKGLETYMTPMQKYLHYDERADRKKQKTALSTNEEASKCTFRPWFCSLSVCSDTSCRGSPGGPALRESWLKGREAWREGDKAIPLVFVWESS